MVLAMILAIDSPSILTGVSRLLWYLATAAALAATVDYMLVGLRFAASVPPVDPDPHRGD